MPLIPKHPRIAPTAPPFDDDTRAALDILVERYESQATFAEHRRTPHFRRNVETELVALLTARSWTVFGVRASGVTPPTTCSPLAVEIDLGELT